MADSVLSKLVQTDKDTKKSLDSMDSTLQRIYKLEVKNTKAEETARKRAERESKRKNADSGLKGLIDALKKQAAAKKKEDKKGGGNALGKMLAFMTGGALLKGLSSAIGSAIGSAFGGLLKGGFGLIGKGLKGTFGKGGLMSKTFGKGGLMSKTFGQGGTMSKFFGKGGTMSKTFGKGGTMSRLFGKGGLGKLFKGGAGKGLGKMIKGGGILAALVSGITEFLDTKSITDALFAGGGAGAGAIAGGALGSLLGPIGTAVGAALGGFIGDQLGKILKDQLDKNPFLAKVFGKMDEMFNNMLADIMKYVDAVKKTFGQFMYMIEQFGRAFTKFNKDVIKPFFKSVGNFFKKTWDRFTGGIKWVANFLDKTFGPTLEKIGEFLAPVLDPLKKLAKDLLGPVVDGFKALLDFLNPIKAATKLVEGAGNVFENIGDFFKNYADGKQQGGFVGTVPNQGGNGDRFKTMLAPGSVVLNQNASRYMQNGGMVPTMLEQGEKVFGPNDPGAGAALAMNSMIPRFQSGGKVDPSQLKEGQKENAGTKQPAGSKVLKVPYYNQRQNKVDGMGTGGDSQCFSTAAAMVVSAVLGEAMTPDAYNVIRSKYGNSTSMSAQLSAMGKAGVPSSGGDNGSYATYKAAIDAGKPVILGLQHNAGSGHMVTGIGYNKEGIVVNDPYGKLNPTPQGGWASTNLSGASDTKGMGVTYPKSLMDGIWVDRGNGTGRNVTPGKGGVAVGSAAPGETLAGGGGGNNGGGGGIMGLLGSALSGFGGAGGFAMKAMGALVQGLGSGLAGALGLGGFGGPTATGSDNQTPGAQQGSLGSVSGSVSEKGKKITAALMSDINGITKEAAAGIAGNMAHESAGFYPGIREGGPFGKNSKPWPKGTVGKGYGWAQWTNAAPGDRYDKFIQSYGNYNQTPTNEDNYNFLLKELNQGNGGFIPGSLNEYKKMSDIDAATVYFRKNWERAGIAHDEPRIKYANDFAKMQTGGVANMSGSSSSSSSRYAQAQEKFAEQIAAAAMPIIIPMPSGGGTTGGSNQVAGTQATPPSLPDGPSSIQSAEYFYRLNMGSAF